MPETQRNWWTGVFLRRLRVTDSATSPNTAQTWYLVLLPIAVLAALFGPVVLAKLLHAASRISWTNTDAQRLGRLTMLTGSLGVLVMVFMQLRGGQAFAISAGARYVVLPVAYLAMTWHVLRAGRSRVRLNFAVGFLGLSLVASAVTHILLEPSSQSTESLVQGSLLLGGFLVTFMAGSAFRGTQDDLRIIVVILCAGGAVAIAIGRGFPPFPELMVPSGFALIALGMRARLGGWAIPVGALLIVVCMSRLISDSGTISFAKALQALVCATILLVFLGGRVEKAVGIIIIGVSAVVLAPVREITSYLGSNYSGDDVTLLQRSYEARTVLNNIQENTLSLTLGLGPGGTLDLSNSPDSRTLSSAGRDLSAVDDVHLMTFWFLMKLGFVGLIAMVAIFIALFNESRIVLAEQKASPELTAILMFVMAGVVDAIPAGAALFSNLLIPLLWGVLFAHRGSTGADRRQRNATRRRAIQRGPRLTVSPPSVARGRD